MRVTRVTLKPSTIEVRGAQTRLQALEAIPTDPITLSPNSLRQEFDVAISLAELPGTAVEEQDRVVHVLAELEGSLSRQWLMNIPVNVLLANGKKIDPAALKRMGVQVRPASVRFLLEGPDAVVKKVSLKDIEVWAELAELKAIAPVYDAKTANRILSPIQFSGDVNGYAFVDQNGRTIIVAFRENSSRYKMHLQGTGNITCKISFNGIQNGTYTMIDIYDNTKTYTLTVVRGLGTVEVPMSRWETRAFSSNIPSPNGTYKQPIDEDSLVLHWKLDETGNNAVAIGMAGPIALLINNIFRKVIK